VDFNTWLKPWRTQVLFYLYLKRFAGFLTFSCMLFVRAPAGFALLLSRAAYGHLNSKSLLFKRHTLVCKCWAIATKKVILSPKSLDSSTRSNSPKISGSCLRSDVVDNFESCPSHAADVRKLVAKLYRYSWLRHVLLNRKNELSACEKAHSKQCICRLNYVSQKYDKTSERQRLTSKQ